MLRFSASLVVFLGLICISYSALSNKRSNPNFIILLGDDVGYGDLSSFGCPNIVTPNIDRLAEEGMKFTQWYSPSALCTPSRGAMLTGKLPVRLGLYSRFAYPIDYLFRVFYPSSLGGLPENSTTIAHALKTKGYFSALIGKWHLGHNKALPTRKGFDYFFGTPYSHDEGYPGPFPTNLIWPPVPVYRNELIVEQPVDLNSITSRMTDEGVSIIDQNAQSGKPFFLVMSYHEAHIPIYAERRFRGSSRRGRYGDMMNQLDWSVGEIMNALRRNNIEQDTFVLFLTDNGAWEDAKEPFSGNTGGNEIGDGGSNGPFREGKGSTWEGGVRGPAIAWWPGMIKPKKVNNEIATHMDILPTYLDILGMNQNSIKETLDGKSVTSLLFDETAKTPHEFLFYWRDANLMAVRWGSYKGHFITRSGFGIEKPVYHDPMLLFNIEYDQSEQFPLDLEAYPDVVSTILKAAEDHKSSVEIVETQFDFKADGPVPGQSWRVVPCCQKQNPIDEKGTTFESILQLPEPPVDLGLIIWKGCLCPRGGGNSTLVWNGRDSEVMVDYSSPNELNSFFGSDIFYGQKMSYYQESLGHIKKN